MAQPKKPTKSEARVETVELIATDKGFDSTNGRIIKEGETFHLPRDQAKRGATWFKAADPEVQAELDAEKAADAKKAKTPAKPGKADKPAEEEEELA